MDDRFEYVDDLRGDGLDDLMMLWLNSGQNANIPDTNNWLCK